MATFVFIMEIRVCLEFEKIGFLKLLISLRDAQTIDALEMDLKEPYHGVKGKALPAAQKAPKTNAVDGRR